MRRESVFGTGDNYNEAISMGLRFQFRYIDTLSLLFVGRNFRNR